VASLFDRAKALEAMGHRPDAIRASLEKEGVDPRDVAIVLGSMGAGPQPLPDPASGTGALPREGGVDKVLLWIALLGIGGLIWVIALIARTVTIRGC